MLFRSVMLSGCARTSAVRTSANTMVIQGSAAPLCGATGAAGAAQRQAAIETIKAGYDGYVIVDAASANNVQVIEQRRPVNTSGQAQVYGNQVTYQERSTYTPGAPMVYGTHDQALAIRMYRAGEPGYENAVPALEVLGPDWAKIVAGGGSNTWL